MDTQLRAAGNCRLLPRPSHGRTRETPSIWGSVLKAWRMTGASCIPSKTSQSMYIHRSDEDIRLSLTIRQDTYFYLYHLSNSYPLLQFPEFVNSIQADKTPGTVYTARVSCTRTETNNQDWTLLSQQTL